MITSLGIGSGLDLNSLLDQLVAAERDPVVNRLSSRQTTYNAELSAYGLLRSALSGLQGAAAELDDAALFGQKSATSSSPDLLTATADSSAAAGALTVEVDQLATAQSLATQTYATADAVIGTGTLTLRFGTHDYDVGSDTYNGFTANPDLQVKSITVGAAEGNNTLGGLRDYINAGDYGLRAAVVNDGSGYRLLLSAENTGAANGVEITVDDIDGDDTDAAGLSALAFGAAATNLEQTVAARDAAIRINGLAVTRATNTIADAVDGLSLDLRKADPGTPVTVTVADNAAASRSAIEGFVQAFNGLIDVTAEVSGYDPTTETGGPLVGDAAIRSILSELRRLITSPVEGLSGSIRSLSEIGITTAVDGRLSVDSARLAAALDEDPDAVAALFSARGLASDPFVDFVSATAQTQPGSFAVNVSQVLAPGTYIGGELQPATFNPNRLRIDGQNESLELRIDGVQSGLVLIPRARYDDGDSLADAIEAAINTDPALIAGEVGATVTYEGANRRFVIASTSVGSSSSVELTLVDTRSALELGLSVGAGAPGTDLAGSIAGAPATADGNRLTATSGNASGITLQVTGSATGARGTVDFARGFAGALGDLIEGYLADDGLIDAREDGITASLQQLSDERAALDERLIRLEERLIAQFSALDTLVGQLQQTSQFLTQQLANLPTADALLSDR